MDVERERTGADGEPFEAKQGVGQTFHHEAIFSRSHADGRRGMPKYLMLSTLSEQGLQTLRANPERVREVNKDVEELGATVVHQWFLLGPHDFVNIVEAEDSSVIAKVSIALGARGSVHTESFEMLEVDDLLSLLSE